MTDGFSNTHPRLTKAKHMHDAIGVGVRKEKGKEKKGWRVELCKRKQKRSHRAGKCGEGCWDV